MQQPPGYFVDAFAGRDGYRLKDAVILGRDLRSDVLGVVGHGLGSRQAHVVAGDFACVVSRPHEVGPQLAARNAEKRLEKRAESCRDGTMPVDPLADSLRADSKPPSERDLAALELIDCCFDVHRDAVKHSFIHQSSTDCSSAGLNPSRIQAMLDPSDITNEDRAVLIREAIASSGKPKNQIAELLGVSAQAITGWETTGRIGKTTLSKLALMLGKPIEQFLSHAKPARHDDDGHVDVASYAQAVGLGDGAEADEYAETHKLKFRAESLARKRLRPHDLAVFYGKGDSMEPRIHSGDAVLFDQSDTRPRDGHLYVILVPGAGAETYSVKRCELIEDMVLFKSDNPKGDHGWTKPRRMDDPRKPIKIIGRVRWIGSWEN
jgi:phage repressor protein C with HTH and peptisase S24 domain